MSVEPLVYTTREDVAQIDGEPSGFARSAIENVHYGSIAVVDVQGRLRFSAGDPEWPTFTRSTLKPFQALPFIREGGPAHFGWTSRHVALMCASHSGEAMHTGIVGSMLDAADCDASRLQCGCHVPGWYAATGLAAPLKGDWSPLEHNCSGKHAGFLAACRLHGEAVDDYLQPTSPLQRRVTAAVATMSGLAPDALVHGTDGCSAPNIAVPLSRLAFLYAQLAQGDAATREGASLGTLFDAMTGHPELVSGTARSDLALMAQGRGDWVTKIGADGVQAIGVRSAGLGIAIKVTDGNRDALYIVVIDVLRQLGMLEEDGNDLPASGWHRTKVHNARGLVIGRVLPAFKMRAARVRSGTPFRPTIAKRTS